MEVGKKYGPPPWHLPENKKFEDGPRSPFVTSERFRVEKSGAHVGYVIYWGAIHFCEVFGTREYADAQCALLNRVLDDPRYAELLRAIRGE